MKLKQVEIIEKMQQGWELGYSNLGNSYWVQEKLCCGGKSENVHSNSVRSLLMQQKIKKAPRLDSDKFWLTRLILKGV